VPADQIADQLRARGLRVTAPRMAVLRAVADLRGHPEADSIAAHARALIGTISTQSVYDSLHTLARVGLVRRIEPAGSPARYETRVGDNHHHKVCRVCATVEDVDCASGEAPCLAADDSDGFAVDEAEVTFWGVCASCQDERGSV
jgi:Fe2+ or Zn2+ uptake regulation protein